MGGPTAKAALAQRSESAPCKHNEVLHIQNNYKSPKDVQVKVCSHNFHKYPHAMDGSHSMTVIRHDMAWKQQTRRSFGEPEQADKGSMQGGANLLPRKQ